MRTKFDPSSDFFSEGTYIPPGPKEGARALERARSFLLRLCLQLLKFVTALALPFFVLVGASVFTYRHYGLSTWLALGTGFALTALLLLLYASWVGKKFTGKRKVSKTVFKGIMGLVAAYTLYALIYLSSLNAKSDHVRDYYRSLNPLLRLAVSTLILADDDVVITDTQRRPEDYERMGLTVRSRSLHYEQRGGYVHALDLRTLGRSGWKNLLMEAYFRVMGFETKRHVGTEDHLHVSLPTS